MTATLLTKNEIICVKTRREPSFGYLWSAKSSKKYGGGILVAFFMSFQLGWNHFTSECYSKSKARKISKFQHSVNESYVQLCYPTVLSTWKKLSSSLIFRDICPVIFRL